MAKTLETLGILTPTEQTPEQKARLEEALAHYFVDTRKVIGQLAMVLHMELELPEPDQQ